MTKVELVHHPMIRITIMGQTFTLNVKDAVELRDGLDVAINKIEEEEI